MVFCARTELAALYQTEYVICDGTFEMAPSTAYQLYTFHGFVHGEALPLAWALLPNKTQATYVELFTAIRSGMIDAYGDTGCRKTFLIDFELAAINGLRHVFPESIVKGCSFHFRQAVYRRVQLEGLAQDYENEYSEIRRWVKRVMSLTSLPTFAIGLIWQWLRVPPACDPTTYAKAQAFSAYVDRTWINGDFPPSLWSQYDNLGPRTTNVAEGWHSGLNSTFGVPHPSLRIFLDWLQRHQYQVQCRGIQLAAGRSPKQRRTTYVNLDAQLWNAKLEYSTEVGKIFCYAFPDDSAWAYFHAVTGQYLDRVSYLLGCK